MLITSSKWFIKSDIRLGNVLVIRLLPLPVTCRQVWLLRGKNPEALALA